MESQRRLKVNPQQHHERLVRLLQLAYSGELAAAYAYAGHWKSVRDPNERAHIKIIEAEEWQHRKLVGEMLRQLGAQPRAWNEFLYYIIGRAAGILCHLTGWLAPMYGAGKLESTNIREYEIAAQHARDCGHEELIENLLTMAEVEWDHEQYFRAQVAKHRLARYLPIWPAPAAKENIRIAFNPGGVGPNAGSARNIG